MKLYSLVASRGAVAMLGGVVLAAGFLASAARADEWDKKTVLTVQNQPIQIRDTVLQPGQYVLRLLDSQGDRHIVQIFDRYQTHIINTVLAVPAQRMEPTGHTTFTFWETPPGTAKAMRDWYYPGDDIGNEFPYPKHLQQIAMVQPAPAPPAPAPAPAPQASAQPEPETPAHSQPMQPAEQPPAEQQPTQVAQNTAPPAAPATNPAPSQLPKTGSPYPLIGFSGVLLLGLYGLLRLKRPA
jgi:LPXTG-motif cell wall-anchored protein